MPEGGRRAAAGLPAGVEAAGRRQHRLQRAAIADGAGRRHQLFERVREVTEGIAGKRSATEVGLQQVADRAAPPSAARPPLSSNPATSQPRPSPEQAGDGTRRPDHVEPHEHREEASALRHCFDHGRQESDGNQPGGHRR